MRRHPAAVLLVLIAASSFPELAGATKRPKYQTLLVTGNAQSVVPQMSIGLRTEPMVSFGFGFSTPMGNVTISISLTKVLATTAILCH